MAIAVTIASVIASGLGKLSLRLPQLPDLATRSSGAPLRSTVLEPVTAPAKIGKASTIGAEKKEAMLINRILVAVDGSKNGYRAT